MSRPRSPSWCSRARGPPLRVAFQDSCHSGIICATRDAGRDPGAWSGSSRDRELSGQRRIYNVIQGGRAAELGDKRKAVQVLATEPDAYAQSSGLPQ